MRLISFICNKHTAFFLKKTNLLSVPAKGMAILLVMLLGGCSGLLEKNDDSVRLDRQIERQQIERELILGSSVGKKRTASEYEVLGDRFMAKKDINRAYLYYLKGLEIEPDHVALLNKQATLLLAKSKYFEAEIISNKVLELAHGNSTALEGRGRARFGLGSFEGAENDFIAALKSDQSLWRSHEYLGLLASRNSDFELAIKEFKAALKYHPQDTSILNNLAVSYFMNGEFEEALAVLERVSRNTGNRKIHNNLGLVYFNLGYVDKSLESFKRGAKSEAEAYNSIGCQYLLHQQFEEAVNAFEMAIFLYPKYYDSAEKNLALAQSRLFGGEKFVQ